MLMRQLIYLCTMLLFSLLGAAQTRTITGVVKNAQGETVPDASVVVKGSRSGTTTNANGNFSIAVPHSAKTLVFSSINFAPQEVNITDKNEVFVSLMSHGQALNEVI